MATTYGILALIDGVVDEPVIETRSSYEGAKRAVKDDVELCFEYNRVTNLCLSEALDFVDEKEGTGYQLALDLGDGSRITWYIVEVR